MLFLIWNLVKAELAVCDRAEERPLTCVYSKMVKKIVPLPKYFIALKVVLIAGEDTLPPACLLIEELNLCEISTSWNMHSSFKHSHVNFITAAEVNSHTLLLFEAPADPLNDLRLHLLILFFEALWNLKNLAGAISDGMPFDFVDTMLWNLIQGSFLNHPSTFSEFLILIIILISITTWDFILILYPWWSFYVLLIDSLILLDQ